MVWQAIRLSASVSTAQGHPATWRAGRPVRSGLRLLTPAPLAPPLPAVNSPRAGVGRTAGSRPCPRAGKSRVAPALSPPRRVTAVPKVYHQRHWAWGGPSATDHDWKNAPRWIATRDFRPRAGVVALPTAAHQQRDRRCRARLLISQLTTRSRADSRALSNDCGFRAKEGFFRPAEWRPAQRDASFKAESRLLRQSSCQQQQVNRRSRRQNVYTQIECV